MTKPRIKYADAFPGIDFEHMKQGTQLSLSGKPVTFEGSCLGGIWIKVRRKIHYVKYGDPVFDNLKVA